MRRSARSNIPICAPALKINLILSYLGGMHIKGHNPRSLYYGGIAGN
jgi:hypothetical protein